MADAITLPSPAAARVGASWYARWRGVLLQGSLTALVVAIAIVPLLYTINAAFYAQTPTGLSTERSVDAIVAVYATSQYLGYLGNALVLAISVTLVSMVAGVTMAVLIARTDIGYKKTFNFFIIMPLYLSPFTGLIAWIALGSRKTGFINVALMNGLKSLGFNPEPLINIWSYGGIVFVMFLFFCPFAYLFTVNNLQSVDSSLEEAARTHGASTLQTILRVTLPLALPAIFASALLIFVLSAEMYTIPGIVGSSVGFITLPWRIYQDSTMAPVHRAYAAASGTVLLWIMLGGVWLQHRITRVSTRFVTVSGKGFRGRPLALGAMRIPAAIFVTCYILASVALPVAALALSSVMKYSSANFTAKLFTLEHYRQILTLQSFRDGLANTLLLALLTGLICVGVGFLISLLEVRRRSRWTKAIAFISVLPVAVPGIVYGLGLIWTYLSTPLYGTIWVLLLAYTAKLLPYGVLVSRSGILQIHPELEQSARVSGATPLQTMVRVTMPLMKASLIAVLFFVMLMSIKELSASVLLYTQDSYVLSVLTWLYMDAGNYQFAAAVGLVQTLIMLAVIAVTNTVFGVRLERTLGRDVG